MKKDMANKDDKQAEKQEKDEIQIFIPIQEISTLLSIVGILVLYIF